MLTKRTLLLALGISGAAVVAVLNICANRLQRADNRAQRKALQRWEGEGGNVLQPAKSDELSQDATP
ncbi:hypothetical protein PMI16_01640 [Herbaspirillum sp. CF444]|uniref:hypothetical protein n=1 Tax=Herbaspirillum sp. CF444 TaxID=1144319 RepID=UPI00027278EB|nr:hypothetical protein [Herbaspirillum sp. CF444]EJL91327.1 hypothetical protein PMI16_01640 [Herbaspirillum sp. CF444]